MIFCDKSKHQMPNINRMETLWIKYPYKILTLYKMLYIPKPGVHDFFVRVVFCIHEYDGPMAHSQCSLYSQEEEHVFCTSLPNPAAYSCKQYNLNQRFPHNNSLHVKNGMLIKTTYTNITNANSSLHGFIPI